MQVVSLVLTRKGSVLRKVDLDLPDQEDHIYHVDAKAAHSALVLKALKTCQIQIPHIHNSYAITMKIRDVQVGQHCGQNWAAFGRFSLVFTFAP